MSSNFRQDEPNHIKKGSAQSTPFLIISTYQLN